MTIILVEVIHFLFYYKSKSAILTFAHPNDAYQRAYCLWTTITQKNADDAKVDAVELTEIERADGVHRLILKHCEQKDWQLITLNIHRIFYFIFILELLLYMQSVINDLCRVFLNFLILFLY